MKEVLVITDLTQMPEGDRVCVVGINPRGESIRPVNQGGFLKKYLYDAKGKIMVRPGAKVQFDLSKTDVNPPHIEDMIFDTDSITGEGMCSLDEWEKTLQVKPFQTVNKMFDGLIQGGGWVLAGAKTRSIGTLMEPKIVDINLTPGSIKPRVKFVDDSGSEFERPVNDLSMWDRCHYLVSCLINNLNN